MSQSKKLSENKNQHKVKNTESKKQDKIVKQVSVKILTDLKNKYPELTFGLDKRLHSSEIEKKVSDQVTAGKNTYLSPDGGLLWVQIGGEKRYILISEQKRQGTNDQRYLDGLPLQAIGNAAERVGKPLNDMKSYFCNEKIIPFIVFFQGCDFHETESTIPDRMRGIFGYLPQNTINLFKIYKGDLPLAGSYYMRGHSYKELPGTSDWKFDEMFLPMFEIAETSLKYYLEKYGE